jgi:hypothetical protein
MFLPAKAKIYFAKKDSLPVQKAADVSLPTLKTVPHASAIIDGTFCQIDRRGLRLIEHAPLGSAVAEFRQGPLCFYVREHAFGLLPGMANLYCLDANLHLRWIAAWPDASDPCAEILSEDGSVLVTRSASGALVRLDVRDGRMLDCASSVAAAS